MLAGVTSKQQLWRQMTTSQRVEALFFVLSWSVFFGCLFVGISANHSLSHGGTYSATDGNWAEWNAYFTILFGNAFDTSPFNAFSGMGSVFLPNTPWLSPGAMALGLPFERSTTHLISYGAYAFFLCASIMLLARTLGFSWAISSLAAQIHTFVFFPPFPQLFTPLEWYSAAPVYAQISALLNVSVVLFSLCGRMDKRTNILLIVGLIVVLFIGFYSAVISFYFFVPTYIIFTLFSLVGMRHTCSEWLWKGIAVVAVGATAAISGIPQYLLATINTAARSPGAGMNWDAFFDLNNFVQHILRSPCATDPRTLTCEGNYILWFHLVGIASGLMLVMFEKGLKRTLGAWVLVFAAFVHVYANYYQIGPLGPLSVLSVHFVSWASYSMYAIAIAGALPVMATFLRSAQDQVRLALNPELRTRTKGIPLLTACILPFAVATSIIVWLEPFRTLSDMSIGLVGAQARPYIGVWLNVYIGGALAGLLILMIMIVFRITATVRPHFAIPRISPSVNSRKGWLSVFATFVTLSLIPALSFALMQDVHRPLINQREPAKTEIVDIIAEKSALQLGAPFRGYTVTYLSEKMMQVPHSPNVKGSAQINRYIGGRDYLLGTYGTTFMEMDLWRRGIPTLEEYGQWISKQLSAYNLAFFSEGSVPPVTNFLRVFEVDFDLFRALGVRFIITDFNFKNQAGVVFLAKMHQKDAVTMYLFEIQDTNLSTYSPTKAVWAENNNASVIEALKTQKKSLDDVVVVNEELDGPYVKATDGKMTLIRDGYRVSARSDGKSLLVLPIQYSKCLSIRNHAPSDGQSPRILRGNYLQTMVEFEGTLDASVELDFGLFWTSGCRLEDSKFMKTMPYEKG